MRRVLHGVLALAIVLCIARLLTPGEEVAISPDAPAPAPTTTREVDTPPPSPAATETSPSSRSIPPAPTASLPPSVRVVDKSTAAPIRGATVTRTSDPLAPLSPADPSFATDAGGIAVLGEPGWYTFTASGFAPRCLWVSSPDGGEPIEVLLAPSGRAAVRLVTTGSEVLPGITVRASARPRLIDDNIGVALAAVPAADLGIVCDSISDADGVARFDGLPAGPASIKVLAGDWVFDSRRSGLITISETGSGPTDVVLRPLVVGAVVVEGLPTGSSDLLSHRLPSGFEEYPVFTRDGPVDCFLGQMKNIKARQKELMGAAARAPDTMTAFVSATRAASPTTAVEAIDHARLLWQRSEVGSAEVRLRPPSLWTADDCARLVVSRDRLGPLTEVRVHFEANEPTPGPVRCPSILKGRANQTRFVVPTDDPQRPNSVSMFVPPGSYELEPDLHAIPPSQRTPPFTFDPVPVIVADTPVDVTARLARPVCLVALDVRDEYGRPLSSFMLQTRRAGIGFTAGVPVLAVDDDEWEFAIAGVEDAGYLGVPKHKEPLQRGRLTTLRYVLRRKD